MTEEDAVAVDSDSGDVSISHVNDDTAYDHSSGGMLLLSGRRRRGRRRLRRAGLEERDSPDDAIDGDKNGGVAENDHDGVVDEDDDAVDKKWQGGRRRSYDGVSAAATCRHHRRRRRIRRLCCFVVLLALAFLAVAMTLHIPLLEMQSSPQEQKLQPLGRGMRHNHNNRPTVVRIMYVHVGKTGGEYVKAQLGSVICKTRKNRLLKEACIKRYRGDGAAGDASSAGVGGLPLPPSAGATATATASTTTSSDIAVASSLLSQQTVAYMHVDGPVVPKNGMQVATHYLYSVRHPLSRLMSWYTYNHPKSCDMREPNSPSCKASALATANREKNGASAAAEQLLWTRRFYECFPTAVEWANKVVVAAVAGTDDEQECVALFWNGWKGQVDDLKHPNHLYWNYEYYWNQTLAKTPNRPILVVRQESLPQDLQALEEYLHHLLVRVAAGGRGDDATYGNSREHDVNNAKGGGSSSSSSSSNLSTQETLSTPIVPRLVLNPVDSNHFLSGKVSSDLDGPVDQHGDRSPRQDSSRVQRQRRRLLCCALLQDEWPIYVSLIQRASNLNVDEKRKSLNEAWTLCGVAVVTDDRDGDGADDADVAARSSIGAADALHPTTMVEWKQKFQALTCG